MPSEEFGRVDEAAAVLASRLGAVPSTAVILGSGLGAFAETLGEARTVPYGEIPHWPASRVVGHAGSLTAGLSHGHPVLALSGRVHLYEGHEPATVTFGIRVLWRLGVRVLIVTNAAGGINTAFSPGTLMVIEDHINLMGRNPLVGPNDDRFGPRFPDMSRAYSPRLRQVALRTAEVRALEVVQGVYLAVSGPSYETPAEIRAFRALGADAVGMSTVPEVIVANHLGLEVLGLTCISNMAAGILDQPLTSDEVIETTARVRDRFITLLEGILAGL